MATVTDALNITVGLPRQNRFVGANVIAYNSVERGVLTITVGDEYKLIRLIGCRIYSTGAATLPAVADGEIAAVGLSRGGLSYCNSISSRPTHFIGAAAVAPAGLAWDWRPEDLGILPEMIPADEINFTIPVIDDNVTPTADIGYELTFLVTDR